MDLKTIEEKKRKLEEARRQALQKFVGKKIFGLKLYQAKKVEGDNVYYPWLANGCRDGQRVNVYIGNDPRRAEEKILSYFRRYPTKARLFSDVLPKMNRRCPR